MTDVDFRQGIYPVSGPQTPKGLSRNPWRAHGVSYGSSPRCRNARGVCSASRPGTPRVTPRRVPTEASAGRTGRYRPVGPTRDLRGKQPASHHPAEAHGHKDVLSARVGVFDVRQVIARIVVLRCPARGGIRLREPRHSLPGPGVEAREPLPYLSCPRFERFASDDEQPTTFS